jgi:starch phosphorylase
VVYVENYEMALGGLLTSGVDLWLNTPTRPLEASGTSGMKAALNGVPSLSVLDGWWIEGCLEGRPGWAVGGLGAPPDAEAAAHPEAAAAAYASADAADLYRKLEQVVMPLYYGSPARWAEVMRDAIAVNGSFFNTQRMVTQYVHNAYAPGGGATALVNGAAR